MGFGRLRNGIDVSLHRLRDGRGRRKVSEQRRMPTGALGRARDPMPRRAPRSCSPSVTILTDVSVAGSGGRVVLLNGLSASGKSVAARWIADQSSGSLCLDIDTLRTFLGDWYSDFRRAGEWVRPLALALLAAHAGSGGTVIIPQLFMDPTEVDPFRSQAHNAGATFEQFTLLTRGNHPLGTLAGGAWASSPSPTRCLPLRSPRGAASR